jgi:hypothetical protein
MKNIKIRIRRNPDQLLEINQNQAEFISSLRGKDAF